MDVTICCPACKRDIERADDAEMRIGAAKKCPYCKASFEVTDDDIYVDIDESLLTDNA
ncbi:MAG: hypothetical protein ACE5PM_08510 [Candidatus Hydrothermarchaeales archaeon]